MAVWINDDSPRLVGLPPLEEATYVRLGETVKEMFAEYKQMSSPDPSDYYTI